MQPFLGLSFYLEKDLEDEKDSLDDISTLHEKKLFHICTTYDFAFETQDILKISKKIFKSFFMVASIDSFRQKMNVITNEGSSNKE